MLTTEKPFGGVSRHSLGFLPRSWNFRSDLGIWVFS